MTQANSSNPTQQGKSKNHLILAVIILILVVIVAIIVIKKQPDEQNQPAQVTPAVTPEPTPKTPPQPEPLPQPQPEPIIPSETTPPKVKPMPAPAPVKPTLPPLDESDSNVFAALTANLTAKSAALVVNDDIIRRGVVFVNNLAQGKVAKKHLPVNPLVEGFSVNQGDVLITSEQSYQRYQPYVTLLNAFSTEQLMQLYHTYLPLLDQAYDEIGDPKSSFTQQLIQAIEQLLATPKMTAPVPLLRDSVTYKYAYSEWESLSPAQKQLLRMGDENITLIKQKLRAFLQKLEAN